MACFVASFLEPSDLNQTTMSDATVESFICGFSDGQLVGSYRSLWHLSVTTGRACRSSILENYEIL